MKKIYAFLLSLIMYSAFAQEGSLDVSYNPPAWGGLLAVDSNNNLYSHTGYGYLQKITPAGTVTTIGPSLNNVMQIFSQSNNDILIATIDNQYAANPTIIRISSTTGAVDPNFTTSIPDGLWIQAIAQLPDGRILIGGERWAGNNGDLNRLYCLNKITGAIDTSFNFGQNGITTLGQVFDIEVDSSGNIFVAGNFLSYNSILRNDIIKLDSNGNLSSFNFAGLNTPPSNTIKTIALQSDGKILIGGGFVHSPSGKKNLLRINADGTLDTGFSHSVDEPFYDIGKILLQATGKIVILGGFKSIGSVARANVARLNTNGSLDLCFVPGVGGSSDPAGDGILDLNQDIFVVGSFNTYDGYARNNLAKLKGKTVNNLIANNDTFNVIQNGSPNSINVLNNDYFNNVKPTVSDVNITTSTPNPIATGINFSTATGTITVSANALPGTYIFSYTLCPKTGCGDCKTAKVTIKVNWPTINAIDDTVIAKNCSEITHNVLANDTQAGIPVDQIFNNVKITLSGTSPFSFNTNTGIVTIPAGTPAGTYTFNYTICTPSTLNCDTATFKITLQDLIANDDSGIVLVNTNSTAVSNILLNDSYFGSAATLSNVNITVINTSHPNITLNGTAINVSSAVPIGIYTLTYKICSSDASCNSCVTAVVTITVTTPPSQPGMRADHNVYHIKTQSSSKIIIAGIFKHYNYIPVNGIARLNNDLTLDQSFNPSGAYLSGTAVSLQAIAIQPNDRIIVAGEFDVFSGVPAKHIARLLENGNPDLSFSSGSGVSWINPNAAITAVAIQNDGRIIIGGRFNKYDGVTRNGIARLYPNGALDPSFDPGSGFIGQGPNSIVIQPDGKILIGGVFTGYKGQPMNKIGRLDASGNIDPSFNSSNSISVVSEDDVNLFLQKDGRIFLYGLFSNFNNSGKNNIVRLSSGGNIDPSFTGTGSPVGTRIWAVDVDPITGQVYIGGEFSYFNNNSSSHYFTRTSSTGIVDNSFVGGYGPGTDVYALKRQDDGKVIIGGAFDTYNLVQANRITRIIPTQTNMQGMINPEQGNSLQEIHNNKRGISIYPNPSEGIFNIDFRGYDENKFDITIYNALGQLIHKASVTPQNTNQIDLTSFGAGSYFITLQNANETINKIVVKK